MKDLYIEFLQISDESRVKQMVSHPVSVDENI